jgi:hypothetical protein
MGRVRFKYLFHGTSSICRAAIEANGLLPVNGLLHLTTLPSLALDEAYWTVKGEDPHHGYKTPVGGDLLIVKVDRSAARDLRLDVGGWYEKESPKIRRLVAKRYAFRTEKPISPEHLSFLDKDLFSECDKLVGEIHLMAKLLPFQYSLDDERRILAKRQGTVLLSRPRD